MSERKESYVITVNTDFSVTKPPVGEVEVTLFLSGLSHEALERMDMPQLEEQSAILNQLRIGILLDPSSDDNNKLKMLNQIDDIEKAIFVRIDKLTTPEQKKTESMFTEFLDKIQAAQRRFDKTIGLVSNLTGNEDYDSTIKGVENNPESHRMVDQDYKELKQMRIEFNNMKFNRLSHINLAQANRLGIRLKDLDAQFASQRHEWRKKQFNWLTRVEDKIKLIGKDLMSDMAQSFSQLAEWHNERFTVVAQGADRLLASMRGNTADNITKKLDALQGDIALAAEAKNNLKSSMPEAMRENLESLRQTCSLLSRNLNELRNEMNESSASNKIKSPSYTKLTQTAKKLQQSLCELELDVAGQHLQVNRQLLNQAKNSDEARIAIARMEASYSSYADVISRYYMGGVPSEVNKTFQQHALACGQEKIDAIKKHNIPSASPKAPSEPSPKGTGLSR